MRQLVIPPAGLWVMLAASVLGSVLLFLQLRAEGFPLT
jgi:hypothetical protein